MSPSSRAPRPGGTCRRSSWARASPRPTSLSTEPQFLGRVQPYSVCLPATYAPGRKLPLTLLLHSLALGQNQFAAIDPRLLHQVCDDRDSVVVTPLARGPSCWYFDEGELDVWEVWARVAEQLGTDPNRTVVSGYSMGGYAAYKLGLTYPEVFAQAVVLAGPPTCGVRLLPDVDIPGDLDPDSHCAREGDTWRLLVNARWLPFVIAHGVLDELVPLTSVLQQVLELDRLGYRYRFTVYPFEDHIGWALEDEFDDPISHMGTGLRQGDPGHITFAWYPQLVRPDLGIGPHRVWWLSDLTADPDCGRHAGGDRIGRRAVVCAAGPHAHHAASSRLRTGPRPVTRAVHRARLADRVGCRPAALPGAASHPRRGTHRGRRQSRACVVARVDDQRCDRHACADQARGAATEHDSAARRPAGRSDSGGARGSAHHHVDHDLGAVGDKPCGSGQMVVMRHVASVLEARAEYKGLTAQVGRYRFFDKPTEFTGRTAADEVARPR